MAASLAAREVMNFVRKSLNSLVKLQQMFRSRTAEIELGMKNSIGITLETGVGVQSAILHIKPVSEFRALYYTFAGYRSILETIVSTAAAKRCSSAVL